MPLLSPDRQLRLFSRVFEDLTDPVIVQDMSGTIVDLNPEAEASYGWTRKELLGQSANVLFSSGTNNQHRELLDQCCRGEMVRNVESVRATKSGHKKFVLLTLSLLTTEQDEPFAIASIAKDITDLKKANAALVRAGQEARRQASQLRRTNEKLNDFVRMCSHDLQAPLRAVENFVSLIRKKYYDRLDSDGNEYIDFVIEGTSVSKSNRQCDCLSARRTARDSHRSRTGRRRLVRAEVKLSERQIDFYALRRRDLSYQPLLTSVDYHFPKRPFKE